jgi:hypothetical protein
MHILVGFFPGNTHKETVIGTIPLTDNTNYTISKPLYKSFHTSRILIKLFYLADVNGRLEYFPLASRGGRGDSRTIIKLRFVTVNCQKKINVDIILSGG